MTEHEDHIDRIARLAPVADRDLAGFERSPGAYALIDGLPAREREPHPRYRPRLPRLRAARIALAGAVAVAVAALATLSAGPAAAGVSFTVREGMIVAEITDPAATAAQLRAAFAERGLDVELELVPASPSLVGTVVMTGGSGVDSIRALHSGRCTTPGGGCPVGLLVPLGFDGHAEVTLAREARAGERFLSSGDAFAPGEALHCSGVRGMLASRARKVLARRGLEAAWRLDDEPVAPESVSSQYVADATPIAPREVLIGLSSTPPEPLSPSYERGLREGCGS